jgi:hypothetical protein
MLANTLSIGGVTLTRINDSEPYSSEYRFGDATHELRFKVRHTKVNPTAGRPGADRHNFELVETVYAAGDVAEYQRKVYVVMENIPQDTSVANADALADLMIASTNAFLVQMVGWES